MKHYKSLDGSPIGTDSTWECGYAISKGKPVIMLIEDKEHIDYYASQWMISFAINGILTTDKEVAEILKNHPKFVHTTILLAENPEQFETKIIEYLEVHINLHNITQQKEEQLRTYFLHHPNIIFDNVVLGGDDFEIEIQVKTLQELRGIISDIKSKFSPMIRNYKYMLFYKEHKFIFLPILEKSS